MTVDRVRFPGLDGGVAVVTGASGAIGGAVARALARHGVAVAASGRRTERLADLVRAIERDGGRAVALPADVTESADLQRLQRETEERLGAVDYVAAVAGGLGEPVALLDLTPDRFRASIEANLTSAFLTMRAFLPGMVARGRGAMVTVSSTAGRAAALAAPLGRGSASPAYAAAKAALLALTRHAAGEVAAAGVRINALAPGAVRNERMDRLPAGVLRDIARYHPLGRVGEPADVAAAALFLLSDAASWITGATLDINGGRVMV